MAGRDGGRDAPTGIEERIAGLVATMRVSAHAAHLPHAPWARFLGELRAAWPQDASAAAMRERWMAFRTRMEPAYEDLAAHLRAARIHVSTLRPTNYVRNLFHVFNAQTALVTVEYAPALVVPIATTFALAAFGVWLCLP